MECIYASVYMLAWACTRVYLLSNVAFAAFAAFVAFVAFERSKYVKHFKENSFLQLRKNLKVVLKIARLKVGT